MHSVEPEAGRRIRIGEDYGTILFVGAVAGTSGVWLGVEWDNGAKRGKHSGDRNGINYFTCRVPNSGSFLRVNTPGLITGVAFKRALLNKYVESQRTSGQDSFILGSSKGAIIVEAPRLDGVRLRISQVERLKTISLDNYDVAIPGEAGEVAKLCPSVQSLDLSQTLIGKWEDVADIIRQMPKLAFLELNLNRLIITKPLNTQNFPQLTHLRLNSTMITWAEACKVLVYFPGLQDLQLGYNELRRLTQPGGIEASAAAPSLTTLNLDSNLLDDWISILQTCATIPNLQNLMLPSNAIASIPPYSPDLHATQPLTSLAHLSIPENPIAGWNNIDHLATWLPHLKDLNVSLEPLKSLGASGTSSREFVISKLPELIRLNGTQVTERERSDAEMFYLSWISKHEHGPEQEIATLHPRWEELSNKYETSRETRKPTIQTLGSSLITVNVARLKGPLCKDKIVDSNSVAISLRVLPTMSTKVFAMKLKKLMKIQIQIEPQALWIVSPLGPNQVKALRCFDEDVLREIAWSGVEDGCLIGLVDK